MAMLSSIFWIVLSTHLPPFVILQLTSRTPTTRPPLPCEQWYRPQAQSSPRVRHVPKKKCGIMTKSPAVWYNQTAAYTTDELVKKFHCTCYPDVEYNHRHFGLEAWMAKKHERRLSNDYLRLAGHTGHRCPFIDSHLTTWQLASAVCRRTQTY